MKRRTGIKAALAALSVCFWVLGLGGGMQYVKAADVKITEQSQLMTAEKAVDMKAAPEDGAEVIVSYQKGDSVFVTGETQDGWYRAIYQGREGYIPADVLCAQEIDVEALDEEMARTEQEAKLVVETIDRYRTQVRRSKIWGGVIIVLVLGIFLTGIVSGIAGKKNGEPQ